MIHLVLCGERGARLVPVTHKIAEQLTPVANQLVDYYVMKHLEQAQIRGVEIVIHQETGDPIRESIPNRTWIGEYPKPLRYFE